MSHRLSVLVLLSAMNSFPLKERKKSCYHMALWNCRGQTTTSIPKALVHKMRWPPSSLPVMAFQDAMCHEAIVLELLQSPCSSTEHGKTTLVIAKVGILIINPLLVNAQHQIILCPAYIVSELRLSGRWPEWETTYCVMRTWIASLNGGLFPTNPLVRFVWRSHTEVLCGVPKFQCSL